MKEREFGKKIHFISNTIKRSIDRKVEVYGVTAGQSRIIGYIARTSRKRDVFQRDIEEEFDIRRSSVTNVLQILEKNGYVSRESVESDARLKKLVLTEKGCKVDKAVHRTILEQEDIVFASLTEEEENQFFFLLDKLADAASNLEDRGGKL